MKIKLDARYKRQSHGDGKYATASFQNVLGPDSIYRCRFTSWGNPIVEIRRSYDRLISTMGFPKLVRWHLYVESGPCNVSTNYHWAFSVNTHHPSLCMFHYDDVIMTTMASQITSLTVVYSTVYSDVDKRKHQSSASLAFVWGIHRDRWIPHTKGQLRGKCSHLMTSSWFSLGNTEGL